MCEVVLYIMHVLDFRNTIWLMRLDRQSIFLLLYLDFLCYMKIAGSPQLRRDNECMVNRTAIKVLRIFSAV